MYEYYVDDSLAKVTAPGITTSFTYNGGSKVSTIKGVNINGATVIDYQYGYTDTEQIAQVTERGRLRKVYVCSKRLSGNSRNKRYKVEIYV
ncbi:hypothetical protein JS44_11575 [Anoxybacillus flavithermus]|uniref:Uncharacterized protein n=1 Tax=Anoxybacillus flavithermus TaxID=33934 RepID=A0A094J2Q0_9BACL|nr:hypothetical protein JS44_11575 [Anoxybacillus flavithermus]